MTAESSLFDQIEKHIELRSGGLAYVDDVSIQMICARYERRIKELEANNKNMASRLKKLMEKK